MHKNVPEQIQTRYHTLGISGAGVKAENAIKVVRPRAKPPHH